MSGLRNTFNSLDCIPAEDISCRRPSTRAVPQAAFNSLDCIRAVHPTHPSKDKMIAFNSLDCIPSPSRHNTTNCSLKSYFQFFRLYSPVYEAEESRVSEAVKLSIL